MLWVGGVGGAIVALWVCFFLITDQHRKDRMAAENAERRAAWAKQHPKGCADIAAEHSGDKDVDITTVWLSTEGNCTMEDGWVVDAK